MQQKLQHPGFVCDPSYEMTDDGSYEMTDGQPGNARQCQAAGPRCSDMNTGAHQASGFVLSERCG